MLKVERVRRVRISLECSACQVTEQQVVEVDEKQPDELVDRRALLFTWDREWRHLPLHSFSSDSPLACSPECFDVLVRQERDRLWSRPSLTV